MHKEKKCDYQLPAWSLTILTLGYILWLTLAPRPMGGVEMDLFPGADKIVHGVMFGFLTFVVFLDRTRNGGESKVTILFAIVVSSLVSLLGIAIEFIQDEMQLGRSFDYLDMVADTTGTFAVAFLWILFEKKKYKKADFNDRAK